MTTQTKAKFSNALIDLGIYNINEYVIALKTLESDGNDYRAGYVEGLIKATKVLEKLRR